MDAQHPTLQRVYNLSSAAECKDVYDDWATTYDDDMISEMEYVAPRVAAQRLADLAPTTGTVLDAGCGTGLVGAELHRLGFTTIDGIDLSAGMLDTAHAKGCYRNLDTADLTARLPLDDATYDAVICVGTLTEGHVGPTALDELVRVTRPGGRVLVAILTRIWEPLGYRAHVDTLVARGDVRLLEADEAPCVEDENCRLCVLEPHRS